MNSGAYLYILRCADGSYYVGTTRKTLEERLAEHNAGLRGGYTATRRPVAMVYAQHFENHYGCGFGRTSSQRMVACEERSDD
jgi:putative endonuclease